MRAHPDDHVMIAESALAITMQVVQQVRGQVDPNAPNPWLAPVDPRNPNPWAACYGATPERVAESRLISLRELARAGAHVPGGTA